MGIEDLEVINPKTRKNLRRWLETNHRQKESVWVTVFKKSGNEIHLSRSEVVEECLCFGWIDSRPRKTDEATYLLLISPRRAKSVWSALNKTIVKQLIEAKLMTSFGLEKIIQAKENGSWDLLNRSDQLLVPDELAAAFRRNKRAKTAFELLPKSKRRAILELIYSSKTDSTLKNRVQDLVLKLTKD